MMDTICILMSKVKINMSVLLVKNYIITVLNAMRKDNVLSVTLIILQQQY